MRVRAILSELCLKILIKVIVFVLLYVEDEVLQKFRKNHKSYPFFVITYDLNKKYEAHYTVFKISPNYQNTCQSPVSILKAYAPLMFNFSTEHPFCVPSHKCTCNANNCG